MECLSEDVVVKICSYLTLQDRLELSYTSKRIFFFVQETWRDYALSMGWKFRNESSWIDVCKTYHRLQKGWFTGEFKSERIPLNEAAQTRQELFGIKRSGDTFAMCTNSDVSCFQSDPKTFKMHPLTLKRLETAENTLAMSGPFLVVVDTLSSELVVLNQIECTEHRVQLPPGLTFDMCHMTSRHVILGTDTGKILLYTMGNPEEILLIHDGEDEISCWTGTDTSLCVAFWTGEMTCFSLSGVQVVPTASFNLGGNVVLYAVSFTPHFLYYGTADGQVGRINIAGHHDGGAIEMFTKCHAGSVYCVATNRTTLVSGGADSRVVFWSLDGRERGSDHMAHIGVVRHIYLNDWLMVTAGDANIIVVWNPVTMTLKHKLHHNPLKIKFLVVQESWMAYGAPDSNFVMCVFVK